MHAGVLLQLCYGTAENWRCATQLQCCTAPHSTVLQQGRTCTTVACTDWTSLKKRWGSDTKVSLSCASPARPVSPSRKLQRRSRARDAGEVQGVGVRALGRQADTGTQ
jgi:hypothetical protein